MSLADSAASASAGMFSADDDDISATLEIAAHESLEGARTLTNVLLRRCGDFLAPSGACGLLQVAIVPGEGRCFYDAVLHQLADSLAVQACSLTWTF